jgi:SAM-dependent methyltransferase
MSPVSAVVDARLAEHRAVWERKETLRLIYGDYYRRLFAACPKDEPVLDIGGGSAHAKEFHPRVVTLDILPFPGIDVVADAHDMPFGEGEFGGIVMIDVLHHLARPGVFLKEAARVLRPGGRLAMIEPGITPVSWPFYNFLHHEPVVLRDDPFEPKGLGDNKDPFDSNQAIPTLMFGRSKGRSRFAELVPELKIVEVNWISLVAYPMSGGFKRWCLVPPSLVQRCLRLEDRVPKFLRRTAAFRLFVVLEKR